MLGRICGWVATTCIASMNASWATFQLQRRILATWTWTKRSSSGHAGEVVGRARRRTTSSDGARRVGVDEHEAAPRRRPARRAGSSRPGRRPAGSPRRTGCSATSRRSSSRSRGTGSGTPSPGSRPRCAAADRGAGTRCGTPGSCSGRCARRGTSVRRRRRRCSRRRWGGAPRGTPSATCGPTPSSARAGRTPARCSARRERTIGPSSNGLSRRRISGTVSAVGVEQLLVAHARGAWTCIDAGHRSLSSSVEARRHGHVLHVRSAGHLRTGQPQAHAADRPSTGRRRCTGRAAVKTPRRPSFST